jgi:hypothetical protein
VQGACTSSVCKYALTSQVTTASVTLARGAAASLEIPNNAQGVRGQVLSDGNELRVVAHLSDGLSNTLIVGEILSRPAPRETALAR